MKSTGLPLGCTCVAAGLVLWGSAVARAGSHTWDVNELFTNADGTIQFIELLERNGTPNETGVPGHNMTSNAKSFTIVGVPLVAPTSNRHYLIATQSFADLPGAPTPDAIIPAGVLPFFFSAAGDTVTYVPWDSMTFGAGAMPTDGIHSLNEPGNTVAVNSPTNYAGVTGSVDASPPGCPHTCGDIDGSGGVVTLVDFASFALCFGEDPSSSTACLCSDFDGNGSINLTDFATFSLTFGTTLTNSAPNCP